MNKICKICLRAVSVIGIAIFTYLSYYSCRYTITRFYSDAYMDNRDAVFGHFIFATLLTVLIFVLGKLCGKIPKAAVHVLALCISVLMVYICFKFIESALYAPFYDQAQIYYNAAKAAGEGIDKGYGYFLVYPFQLGLVEVFTIILKLSGSISIQTIEYVQAVLVGISAYTGFRIVRELFDDRCCEIIYIIINFAFLPIYIYAMFVYGETLGICASLIGIWTFICANRDGNKKITTVVLYVVSMLAMTMACIARGALIIIWIAMLIIQLLITVTRKNWLQLLLVAVMLPVIVLGENTAVNMAEKRADYDFGEGSPKIMWIAMGLQENEDSELIPGSYNGFNQDPYIECGYDSSRASEIAKEAIKESLSNWMKHPDEMLSFFRRKIMCQWNNPDYGAFYYTHYMEEPEEWLYNLYFDDEVNGRAIKFLDNYQLMFYVACALFFLMLFRKNKKPELLLPGLILVGEFMLSLIWESSSRYVYPCIVICMPCAAAGLTYVTNILKLPQKHIKEDRVIIEKNC